MLQIGITSQNIGDHRNLVKVSNGKQVVRQRPRPVSAELRPTPPKQDCPRTYTWC